MWFYYNVRIKIHPKLHYKILLYSSWISIYLQEKSLWRDKHKKIQLKSAKIIIFFFFRNTNFITIISQINDNVKMSYFWYAE